MPVREGVMYPKFADKFYKIDFEAEPMPVLCLYPIPASVELDALRLQVCGLEEHPRSISWRVASELPRVTTRQPLICQIFNWSEVVEWEGVRLVDFLDYFKIETDPEGYYAFYSRDGVYFETLSRDEARDPRVILAYGMNGQPLPIQHGGPLRLVVPFLQGYKSVKWIGSIRTYRYDPQGIKRLLGQSPSGRLREEWLKRYEMEVPAGRPGDPPLPAAAPVVESPSTPPTPSTARREPSPVVRAVGADGGANGKASNRPVRKAVLRQIIAIVRLNKHEDTQNALEELGDVSYTTYPVVGRGRQRGLRFPPATDGQVAGAAIKFLPKQLFQIVVEESRAKAVIDAIIRANRTGSKGEFGDGKIYVLDAEDAVRVSTNERGGDAI